MTNWLATGTLKVKDNKVAAVAGSSTTPFRSLWTGTTLGNNQAAKITLADALPTYGTYTYPQPHRGVLLRSSDGTDGYLVCIYRGSGDDIDQHWVIILENGNWGSPGGTLNTPGSLVVVAGPYPVDAPTPGSAVLAARVIGSEICLWYGATGTLPDSPQLRGTSTTYATGKTGISVYGVATNGEPLDNFYAGTVSGGPQTVTIGQPSESDTATVFRRVRNRSITQPSSANTALTVKSLRARHLSQPTESDTATVFAHYKTKRMSQPSEADTANVVRPVHVRYLTEPSEADTAAAFVHPKALHLTQPAEADTATTFVKKKVRATTQPSETDTANAFGRVKTHSVTQPAEADSATAFVRHKTKTTAQPAEADVANAMARLKVRSTSQVTEADSAIQFTRLKLRAFGLAAETDASFSFTRGVFGLTHAIETDVANQIARKAFHLVNKASEADSALAFVEHKTRSFGQPSEADTANTVQPRRVHFLTLGLSLEADSALTSKARRAERIVQPSEVDNATAFGKRHSKTLAQPSSLNTALTLVPHKDLGFGKASEGDAAQRINVGLPMLVIPAEHDLALSTLIQRKIRQPVEVDTPVPAFTVRQTFTNIALEIDSALALGNAQHPSVAAEPMLFSVGIPSLKQLNKTRLLEVG